jgi:hypothetical protein
LGEHSLPQAHFTEQEVFQTSDVFKIAQGLADLCSVFAKFTLDKS